MSRFLLNFVKSKIPKISSTELMFETPGQEEERKRLVDRQAELQEKLANKEGNVAEIYKEYIAEIYKEYMINTKILKDNHNIIDNMSGAIFYPHLTNFSIDDLKTLDNTIDTVYVEKTKRASSGGKKSKKRRSTKRRSTKRKRPTKRRRLTKRIRPTKRRPTKRRPTKRRIPTKKRR